MLYSAGMAACSRAMLGRRVEICSQHDMPTCSAVTSMYIEVTWPHSSFNNEPTNSIEQDTFIHTINHPFIHPSAHSSVLVSMSLLYSTEPRFYELKSRFYRIKNG